MEPMEESTIQKMENEFVKDVEEGKYSADGTGAFALKDEFKEAVPMRLNPLMGAKPTSDGARKLLLAQA